MVNTDFLDKILAHKRVLNEQKRAFFDKIKNKLETDDISRYTLFKRQISRPGQLNLIAEVKKASPSKGMLREDFDPGAIAMAYEKAGAAAVSVLTEDKFFLGRPEYIKILSEKVSLPFLAKDFFIDEGQVYEAALNGASAILIIMAMISDEDARSLMATAHSLDLDCLVEVHNDAELDRAVGIGAEIIGINNRDLHTFEVDIETTFKLLPKIPSGVVSVAESGISSFADIKRLQDAGANAVLIGETFMREVDIEAKVKDVMHGQA